MGAWDSKNLGLSWDPLNSIPTISTPWGCSKLKPLYLCNELNSDHISKQKYWARAQHIFSRPKQSQGLLYKHSRNYLVK